MPIKCYIIGDGSQKKNLEQLARVLKIEELVTFTGKVDHIGDYLQILDIFVLPSNSGESFGNSAVEAMGMGIPTIVMNDGGGLLEHITENGGLIVKDIEQLSKSIEKLAKNKSMCQNMGSLGKKYITAKYSIDNMLKGYQNFYEQENEFSTNNYL